MVLLFSDPALLQKHYCVCRQTAFRETVHQVDGVCKIQFVPYLRFDSFQILFQFAGSISYHTRESWSNIVVLKYLEIPKSNKLRSDTKYLSVAYHRRGAWLNRSHLSCGFRLTVANLVQDLRHSC